MDLDFSIEYRVVSKGCDFVHNFLNLNVSFNMASR